ncbi:hypothetical protein [Amycolatopsis minnesotensis]|uniref:Uncharacterized protein n=1 Tax=Amycolatopsis minnesotensis TaxID=337894 RepID=A0ABP5BBS2_9PSEU
MTIALKERVGQELVSVELFDRLASRIAKEHHMPRGFAARIMDQALAFLAVCAQSAEPLAPSEAVDIGWHTFILYTREYAAFCERIAGQFIHHEPTDTGVIPVTRTPVDSMSATTRALRTAGYRVDLPLWKASADCNQCTNGCTHSSGDTGCHHHPVRTDTVPA